MKLFFEGPKRGEIMLMHTNLSSYSNHHVEKKADKKIGIFNKRVKIQAHDTSVGNKKIIYGENPTYFHLCCLCRKKAHTMEADWLQIAST